MSYDLQDWLALAIVIVVAGSALWRHLVRQKSSACNDCSVASCRPPPGGKPLAAGGKTDPYRPRLTRPED